MSERGEQARAIMGAASEGKLTKQETADAIRVFERPEAELTPDQVEAGKRALRKIGEGTWGETP